MNTFVAQPDYREAGPSLRFPAYTVAGLAGTSLKHEHLHRLGLAARAASDITRSSLKTAPAHLHCFSQCNLRPLRSELTSGPRATCVKR
jgi:hypothetical protein